MGNRNGQSGDWGIRKSRTRPGSHRRGDRERDQVVFSWPDAARRQAEVGLAESSSRRGTRSTIPCHRTGTLLCRRVHHHLAASEHAVHRPSRRMQADPLSLATHTAVLMKLRIFLDMGLVDWRLVVGRLVANMIHRTVTDTRPDRVVRAWAQPAGVVEVRDDPSEIGDQQQRNENAGQAVGGAEDSGLHRRAQRDQTSRPDG